MQTPKRIHCIMTGQCEVVIPYEDYDVIWKVLSPSLSRTDSHRDDYVVANDDSDDEIVVNSSIVDDIYKAINHSITQTELAVLIAKVNFDRIGLPSHKENQIRIVEIESSSALPLELPLELASFMHEVIEAVEVDDSMDYIPYNFLAENDIAHGLSELFLHSDLSFLDVYTCFSELTPQQVETILLAREPYEVLTRYW